MFPPTEGTVLYRGADITRIPAHGRVGRGIVRTFQLVSVFDSLTVRENLVLALIRAGKEHAASARFFLEDAWSGNLSELSSVALGTVGLREKALWKTSELSYGDKRKLEIALALCLRPSVLLLDEPFAGLSDVEIVEVLELIHRVRKEFTLVIIEHKISRIVDLVSRLSVMHEGKLIARVGPPRCSPTRWSGRSTGGGRERVPAHGRRGRRRLRERERTAQGVASGGPRRNGVHRWTQRRGEDDAAKDDRGIHAPAAGAVRLEGRDLRGIRPENVARLGVRYVFQDKRVFSKLTVRENLELAAHPSGERMSDVVARMVSIYPAMEKFLDSKAGGLSGGQRQILLIGRALTGNPKILLVDEPTEGLAAGVIDDIFRLLSEMKGRLSMLIVEQNLPVVARLADRVYVMKEGKIFQELITRAEIEATGALEKNL